MSDAKQKAKRERVLTTVRGYSGEPMIDKDSYSTSFVRALNWYGANEDEKKIIEYALTYVKANPELKSYSSAIKHASYADVKPIGVMARLLRREQYVSPEHQARIKTLLDEILSKHKAPKEEEIEEVEVAAAPVATIQTRMLDSARKFAAEVDYQIDEYVANKSSDFSMKSYLVSSAISGPVAKRMGELYKPLITELTDAIEGADDQLKEGYSNFTKPQLKKFLAFVQSIVDECSQQVVSARAQRKPRARKVKPASVIVAKMKYMKEYTELKLKSISPTMIIGADELWVYTPEKRKLTVYRAANGGSLSVSGMSILNYDLATSETKTIRKPEEFFKSITTTGKRALANAWKNIKGKATTPRSRINEDMILFAAN